MDKDLTKAFKEFSQALDLPAFSSPEKISPEFDVKDHKHDYTVTAKIPGMNLEDFKISLKKNLLTIESTAAAVSKHEASFGKFTQDITFTDPVNPAGLTKTYERDQLKIVVPKVAKQLSH